MIIMGVDPGTLLTGYGVLRVLDQGYEVIDYGCIRPPREGKLTDRYRIIFEGICQLLDQFHPDVLVVETQYVQKNIQSAIKLGMARGIILLAATLRDIAVYEYAPAKAKRAVVGNGRASKHQVKMMVQRLLHLREAPEPEDAADALALAICHAQTSQFSTFLTGMI